MGAAVVLQTFLLAVVLLLDVRLYSKLSHIPIEVANHLVEEHFGLCGIALAAD
jgi:hypothetical protein